jgi:hypothetical protein
MKSNMRAAVAALLRHSVPLQRTRKRCISTAAAWTRAIPRDALRAGPAARPNQLTVQIGRMIVNSFDSQHALSGAVEYRRAINRWVEWTATFLDEGDARLVERNGIATQPWATRHLYDDRIAVCVGLGPCFTIERGRLDSSDRLAALTTLSGSYAVTPRRLVRVSWNRVFADQRDTDVLLAGIGYMF